MSLHNGIFRFISCSSFIVERYSFYGKKMILWVYAYIDFIFICCEPCEKAIWFLCKANAYRNQI